MPIAAVFPVVLCGGKTPCECEKLMGKKPTVLCNFSPTNARSWSHVDPSPSEDTIDLHKNFRSELARST